VVRTDDTTGETTTRDFHYNSYDDNATSVMSVLLAMKYDCYGGGNRATRCTVELVDNFLRRGTWNQTEFHDGVVGHTYDTTLASQEEKYIQYVGEKGLPALPFRTSRGGEDSHSPPSAALIKVYVERAADVSRVCTLQMMTYTASEVSPPPCDPTGDTVSLPRGQVGEGVGLWVRRRVGRRGRGVAALETPSCCRNYVGPLTPCTLSAGGADRRFVQAGHQDVRALR
jgi:hypothetical protein